MLYKKGPAPEKVVETNYFSSVDPMFNPKSGINESLHYGSISGNQIYGTGSIGFKCRWNSNNTIMNYDREWDNEASIEDIEEFEHYTLTYFLQK